MCVNLCGHANRERLPLLPSSRPPRNCTVCVCVCAIHSATVYSLMWVLYAGMFPPRRREERRRCVHFSVLFVHLRART